MCVPYWKWHCLPNSTLDTNVYTFACGCLCVCVCVCVSLGAQECQPSVTSCTMTAVRSRTPTSPSRWPWGGGRCTTAWTCSSPACSSLAWPCWSSCCPQTLGRRSLWVRGGHTHTHTRTHTHTVHTYGHAQTETGRQRDRHTPILWKDVMLRVQRYLPTHTHLSSTKTHTQTCVQTHNTHNVSSSCLSNTHTRTNSSCIRHMLLLFFESFPSNLHKEDPICLPVVHPVLKVCPSPKARHGLIILRPLC